MRFKSSALGAIVADVVCGGGAGGATAFGDASSRKRREASGRRGDGGEIGAGGVGI